MGSVRFAPSSVVFPLCPAHCPWDSAAAVPAMPSSPETQHLGAFGR